MFIPETKITINKIGLSQYFKEINKYNEDFYKGLFKVFSSMGKNQQYAYLIDFPYGYPIIKFGRMYLLDQDQNGNYLRKNDVQFNDEFQTKFPDGILPVDGLWDDFVKDCRGNSDHPLSMVLSNFVEMFTEQLSGVVTKAGSQPRYKLPLNHVGIGGLFGVWGTIDMVVFRETIQKRLEWHGTTGRSCFQFLLPIPKQNKSNQAYQTSFKDVFGIKTDKLTIAMHHLINKMYGKEANTQILIFPEHYFVTNSNMDSDECKLSKIELQHYLFGYGWIQFKRYRDLLWESKELAEKFKFDHNNFNFQISNHFLNILNCTDYALTLVSEDEPILFGAFKHLCEEFEKITFTERKEGETKPITTNLLAYNTPLFFYYSTLKESQNQWVLVPYYAPALNTSIPKQSGKTGLQTVANILLDHELVTTIKSLCTKHTGKKIEIIDYCNKGAFLNYFVKKYLKEGESLSKLFKPNPSEDPNENNPSEEPKKPEKKFPNLDVKIKVQPNKDYAIFNSFFLIEIS